ncbi:MAG: guanylate kinase [PS1 clade bacterium]|nr:guanylate kinase [PS1 clade bacterium]CAI8355147.1 MAG: Guanylate kinase [Rhodobiaceae bacterium UBA7378]HCQ81720.1 guanylate kinase [Rhodobiaceae bacterium]|tara:strand:- start:675 stop:1307 length:633 start_codon:yes stop_codon:yes gene_type:complete
MSNIIRRGLMLVLSSPSGAGKTTLSRGLLADDDGVDMSVSLTTRPPRPGEVEGQDYYFVDRQRFGEMRNRSELLEHAKVFDNYYGTPRAPVEAALSAGRDVLFDIDWQGTQQLQEAAADDLVRVFILPPTAAELERRLKTRAQDSADVVAGRMAKASDEISHYAEYEYIVVNHDAAESLVQIKAILTAERLKRARQTGLSDFVHGLREAL